MRRLIIALALAGVASLGIVAPALGHAQLVLSTPAAGEILPESPSELRLTFSEPLEAGYSSIDLINGEGDVLLERGGQPDSADAFTLVIAVPSLADGVYTILWRTLSAADGHTAQGFLIFGVGEVELPGGISGSGAARGVLHPGHNPQTVVLDDVGRTASYGGLMLAFGLAVVGLIVLRPAFGTLPGWALNVQLLGLAAAAAGAVITLLVNVASVSSTRGGTFDPLAYISDSRTGGLLATRFVLVTLAALLAMWLRRGRPLAAVVVAGAAGAAGVVLAVLAGHAAGYQAIAPVAVAVAHVLAAAIWVSGLVALSFISLARGDRVARLRASVPRFSALALASIGLVAVTGAYNVWLSTREFLSLATPYQLNLGIKAGLVGLALAIGGLNYLDHGRSAGKGRWGIGRRVLVEAGIAGLVVLATANLTAGSPSAQGRPVPIATAPGTTLGGPAYLALTPGTPGLNAVRVDLVDIPLMDSSVVLVLQRLDEEIGTSRLPLLAVDEFGNPLGEGGHAAHGTADIGGLARHVLNGLQLPDGSRWDATVVMASRDGTEMVRRRFTFTMGPDGVTDGRDLPPVDPVLALAVLLLGAGVLALAFRLGGGCLPLTDPEASHVALVGGAVVSLLLGVLLLLAGPSL